MRSTVIALGLLVALRVLPVEAEEKGHAGVHVGLGLGVVPLLWEAYAQGPAFRDSSGIQVLLPGAVAVRRTSDVHMALAPSANAGFGVPLSHESSIVLGVAWTAIHRSDVAQGDYLKTWRLLPGFTVNWARPRGLEVGAGMLMGGRRRRTVIVADGATVSRASADLLDAGEMRSGDGRVWFLYAGWNQMMAPRP